MKARGCTFLVDPGWDPGNWQEPTLEGIRRLLPKVDYFLPNLEEAVKIAGGGEETRLLDFFREAGPGNLIVKQGPRGCLGWIDGRLYRSKAYAAQVADTTAAGDIFDAAVVHGLCNGIETARMLDFANAAASFLISRNTERFPGLGDIEAIVARDRRI